MAAKKAKNQATTQGLRRNIENPPLPPTIKGKLSSQMTAIDSTPVQPSPHLPSHAIDEDDDTVAYNDKVARLQALQARWAYEDTEEEALVEDALQARQKSRCKELGLIVFGFTLHDAQVEAIHTLFFEQRDLLLLAKTGFGKSLIFQLLPFFTAIPGVVLTLMPLKLL